MADFVPPSIEDFLDRFPEFGDMNETVISLILAEANTLVGDSWIPEIRVMGVLLLAAHILYSENLVFSKQTFANASGQQVSGPITQQTVGPLSTTYKDSTVTTSGSGSQGVSNSALSTSPYGLRFLELLHLSEPAAILVV